LDHARSLGFDSVLSAPLYRRSARGSVFSSGDFGSVDPALGLGGAIEDVIATLARAADERGLNLLLDLSVEAPLLLSEGRSIALDPRLAPQQPYHGAVPDDEKQQLIQAWKARLARLVKSGVRGFRCLGLALFTPDEWQQLISATKLTAPETRFFAFTPGTDFVLRGGLRDHGFDGSFSSFGWWDLKEGWFLEEYRLQQPLGCQITFPEAPFARRLAHGTQGRELLERRSVRAMRLAAWIGDGILVPMGFEYGAVLPLDPTYGDGAGLRALRTGCLFDISAEIRAANAAVAERTSGRSTDLQLNADVGGSVTVFARPNRRQIDASSKAHLAVVNRDLRKAATMPRRALREIASPFIPREGEASLSRLSPGEMRLIEALATEPIETKKGQISIEDAVKAPRLAIETITPQIDGGRFPVKRIVGDIVTIEADIFADGHDVLAASLLYRAVDERDWQETRMSLVENDRWRAAFALDRVGRYEFCVEAWRNPFAIFRYELSKKHEARLDLHLELREGIALIEEATIAAAGAMPASEKDDLAALVAELKAAGEAGKTELLLSPRASALMAIADQRPYRVRSQPSPIDAERRQAAFASWYQIFPRSQSGDPNRHGTFIDVIDRLPAIRAMGFDVLYFPPIHPIGKTNRKGRNNSLVAGPDDPGSPYAIGSKEGGHDAIHAELGDFDDFDRLVEAAAQEGLEIALDLAIQASPDHPWLTQHPGWFDWRPDGTIRYAENPPKKYEDIVNVDFYTGDAVPDLWINLRDIVEMWVGHGVKLFRVDNPHTKPLPFWEWLIGDIRARHPEVVFLSEAFTRPKVMYRLAKVGFSQSYTYFTWRNSKWELEQYMRELTREAPRDFFRPHFFVNTHDINPDFLQNAPRPAYLIRAALAATLSGLWGVYNGFELCEGRPDAKRKEYADSEKYEIRAWDYDRPGNIKAEIAMLNRIRRENPALQSHLGLTLLNATNDNVMFFEKASPGRHNVVLVAVSLDPHSVQESTIELPLWHFGMADDATLALEDLIGGTSFNWTGKWQRIGFDPNSLPFAIWRVRAREV
jgi:starch synthase (maltosyl-transferring)